MRMDDWYRTLVGVFIVLFVAAQQLAVSSNTGIQVVPQIKTSIQNSELSGAAADLWVDAEKGNNTNNGLSPATALLTIQHAADLAGPGTTIHIQPGVYRESILPAQSGTASAWIRYTAESGPDTVKIRGSDPSSALTWTQLTSNTIGLPPEVDPTHIYYADISSWGLSSPPRFVVELNAQGEVSSRLPQAREPDWSVVSEWKYHEFWWAADGGNNVAACNPPTDANPLNCDAASRSLTQLTDRNNDAEPTGIEPGNLTTLGNLTGAALVVKDTVTGTFVFHRKITSHDVTAGRITVDQKCEQGSGSNQPALGWGSKYYIEGLPRLMDSPGEWWYDQSSGRLYLYPRSPGNPAAMNIEISRRLDGINLIDRSYITLNGLTVEFFNRNAVYVSNDSYDMSHGDTIQNTILRYASNGVWLRQYVDPNAPLDRSIDGFTIENSEIAFMDDQALHIYSTWGSNSSAASFTRPGVLNIAVRHNELHHLGFNAESEGVGAQIAFADHFTFEDNHIHHVAHNGIQFMRSVIQSSKKYGFSPAEIKTGNILIGNNIFEKACQNASDCGALKISGTPPDRQVFRDLLVTGNIFRDTIGWTYIAEKRGHFDGGPQSDVQGMGGFGFYVDNASGMNVYRNIAYNNAFAGFKLSGVWRDGDIIYYNNTIANSLNGFHFGGKQYDTHDGSVNTRLVNNIMVNNEDYAILLSDADGDFENTIIDHNLYENNGWRTYQQGGEWISGNIRLDVPGSDLYYQTLADIQAGTSWEDHGVEGDPAFWSYDITDHALFDGSSPDFHLTSNSTNAIDRGSASLPASLTALLNKFVIVDPIRGTAPDIGRYEAGFSILPDPSAIAVEPGGTARFTLRLYPSDLPNSVTLNTSNPDPAHLVISLEPTTITAATPAVLTITDTHTESTLIPGLWYSITIGGDGAGFTSTTILHLLVGGVRLYLPVIAR